MVISAATAERRTAMVYGGAALLILVVGIRTVLGTSEEGFTFITYATIGALLLEFVLLNFYALTIFQRAGAHEEPAEVSGGQLGGVDISPILDRYDELLSRQDISVTKIEELLSTIHEQKVEIAENTQKVASLAASLETIVNGEVNRRIREQIQEILSSAISVNS